MILSTKRNVPICITGRWEKFREKITPNRNILSDLLNQNHAWIDTNLDIPKSLLQRIITQKKINRKKTMLSVDRQTFIITSKCVSGACLLTCMQACLSNHCNEA